jgi:butyrate kinase
MFNIAEFLQKYANLEGDSTFQEQIIKKTLKDVCNIEKIDFEVKKGTLYLKTNPLVKSIIFMNKEKIINYLKQNFPKGRISNIR